MKDETEQSKIIFYNKGYSGRKAVWGVINVSSKSLVRLYVHFNRKLSYNIIGSL